MVVESGYITVFVFFIFFNGEVHKNGGKILNFHIHEDKIITLF